MKNKICFIFLLFAFCSLSFAYTNESWFFFIKPGLSVPFVRDESWDNRGIGFIISGGGGYGLFDFCDIYSDLEYTRSPFDYQSDRIYPAIVDGAPYKIASDASQSVAFSLGLKGNLMPKSSDGLFGFCDMGIYTISIPPIRQYFQRGMFKSDVITKTGWTSSFGIGYRYGFNKYEFSLEGKYRFLDRVVTCYVPTNKSAKDIVLKLGFTYRLKKFEQIK